MLGGTFMSPAHLPLMGRCFNTLSQRRVKYQVHRGRFSWRSNGGENSLWSCLGWAVTAVLAPIHMFLQWMLGFAGRYRFMADVAWLDLNLVSSAWMRVCFATLYASPAFPLPISQRTGNTQCRHFALRCDTGKTWL